MKSLLTCIKTALAPVPAPCHCPPTDTSTRYPCSTLALHRLTGEAVTRRLVCTARTCISICRHSPCHTNLQLSHELFFWAGLETPNLQHMLMRPSVLERLSSRKGLQQALSTATLVDFWHPQGGQTTVAITGGMRNEHRDIEFQPNKISSPLNPSRDQAMLGLDSLVTKALPEDT